MEKNISPDETVTLTLSHSAAVEVIAACRFKREKISIVQEHWEEYDEAKVIRDELETVILTLEGLLSDAANR